MDSAERQREFYSTTASTYDAEHGAEFQHKRAFRLALPFLVGIGVSTVLDVGCGTGRGMRLIEQSIPDAQVIGVDPSAALLEIARVEHGIAADRLIEGSGEHLPFDDGSFDAAVAVAVLHHVADPWPIVQEMLRVSTKAVVISDVNRYGSGQRRIRAAKVALKIAGLSDAVDRRRNGPDRHYESDGDGIAWPFSLLDLVPMLEDAGIEVFAIPTAGTERKHAFPLGSASHVALIGVKATHG